VGLDKILGWRDLGSQISQIERDVFVRTGSEPLVVGLDKYMISSELAFYDYESDSSGAAESDAAVRQVDGWQEAAGRHFFGKGSLMYAYWFPPAEHAGRHVIMVDHEAEPLNRPTITQRFRSLGDVLPLVVRKNGQEVVRYYYRVGYDYREQS
jgi:hypothetical protein